jgi:hypothetical protein
MITFDTSPAFQVFSFDPKGFSSSYKRIAQPGAKHNDHQPSAKVTKEFNDRLCLQKGQKRNS